MERVIERQISYQAVEQNLFGAFDYRVHKITRLWLFGWLIREVREPVFGSGCRTLAEAIDGARNLVRQVRNHDYEPVSPEYPVQ